GGWGRTGFRLCQENEKCMMGNPPPGQTPEPSQSAQASQSAQGAQPAGSKMAPGGMSGGPPPGPGGDEVKLGDVKWGKIFKMGWKIVGYSKYLALLYCVMTLLQNGLNLSTAQLMGEVTKSLSGRNNPVVAAPPDSASTASTASTTIPAIVAPVPQKEAESSILPPRGTKKRVIVICVLWALCALGVLGFGIPFRAISTKLDLTISNRLRSRLFERLLRQSPEFYYTHDPGELNAVANQFTVEAAMTMRQIAVDMLLQIIVLGFTVGLLIYNFQMEGPPPTIFGVVIPPAAIPIGIVLFAF